ncbi:MAG: S41 family peptidase [Thermoguttaceae bacterium]|jgi:carboxyl-terminal processing protease
MRRSVLAAASGLLLAVFSLLIAPAALAQQTNILSLTPRTVQVDDLLRRGQDLEVRRRWGEALTHYEDALRVYPDEASLERHFELARMHYDLARRFSDRSFCQVISRLPTDKALELYAQVLGKIQSHYVEPANWKDLIERGTTDLEVALNEPAFVERNFVQPNPAGVSAYCRELRESLAARAIGTREEARDCVARAAALAQRRLGLPPTVVVLEYLCGATNSLDPYTAFLTPDQLNDVYSQIEGNFVGLGIELKSHGGGLMIVRVITGSPAERAGVRAGDRILAVDGRSTAELSTDQAANLLQGVEGSMVALSLASPGQSPRQSSIRRQRVEVPSVDQVQMVDAEHGAAYLKLTCFQRTTRRDLEAALWKLHGEGMRSLVMDLRGNPGGLLLTSVEVANLFLDHGVIVSTHGRSPQEDFTYTAHAEGAWRVPLVVLIDQDSASAAEIFAGAIRDHHRGTLVGVRSFGKGSVQGIFPLESSEAGVRLTTAKFFSPTGRPFARVGVEPDVVVHQAARPVEGNATAIASDAMLAAAMQVTRDGPR